MARPKGYRLFVEGFREQLVQKGLSQADVAARSMRSEKTISGLVHGDQRASAATVQAVASALECNPVLIFPEMGGIFTEREAVPA